MSAEICRLPVDIGLCQGSMTRFSFNALSSRCEQFSYTGCEGNGNNFETLKECIEACSKKSIYPLQKIFIIGI